MSTAMESQTDKLSHSKALPLVAIVGPSIICKSSAFNYLNGERRSIGGDEPGITRDRIYGEADWRTKRFAIVDTGGTVPDDDAVIPANILKQAGFAIDAAAAIVWVVDARKGITPLDQELARLLRSTGTRVLVAANKADAVSLESDAGEFHSFGFADVFAISAEHGNGIGELLDTLVTGFPAGSAEVDKSADERNRAHGQTSRELRLAIVGRPNVGKSSLLNRLLGEERAIVSPVAGTTRDTVDTLLETEGQSLRIIDTAGIRRKGKTEAMAEKLSVVMARKSLERADVAIVVLDAEQGIAALDAAIAGYALEAGCSIILVLNKVGTIEKKNKHTGSAYERQGREQMKVFTLESVVNICTVI